MLNSAVIGSGGAGRNVLSMLPDAGIPLYLINSVKDTRYRSIFARKSEIIAAVSTDPNVKRRRMQSEKAAIEVLEEHDVVFSVSGMGGFYGTAVPVMLSRLSGNLIPFVALPFSMEGEKRRKQAEKGLYMLKKSSPWILVLENDGIMKIAPNATVSGAFRAINRIFAECIIGLDRSFEDRYAVINALKGTVGAGIGEGEGMNRAEKALKDAFSSPWLKPEKRAILIMNGGSKDDFLWIKSEIEDAGIEASLENHIAQGDRIELLVIG